MSEDPVLVGTAVQLLADSGLRLDPSTQSRLHGFLRRSRTPGETPHEQAQRLRRDPASLAALVDEMTVQETSFFRDAAQLDVLADHVLPGLPDPVVVWSAGCANGQEPWSVAMLLRERGRQGVVHATDLSERAVARTREGVYAERELRGLSEERRRRWLEPCAGGWRVVDELRPLVHVQQHNLLSSAPPVSRVPVVLCRNVLIYFPPEAVRQAVGRFASVLPDDGWLLLGFSESLWKVDDRFAAHRVGTSYVHRRPQAGPPPEAVTAPRAPRRPSPHPVRDPAPRPGRAGVPPRPVPALADLLAEGERALRGGDHAAAVTAYRAAAFLAPGHVLAHLQLSLSLSGAGQPGAARRALLAARHALEQAGADTEALDGWDVATLQRFIAERLEVPG